MTLQWATVRAITPKWGQLGTVVNARPTKITLSTTRTHPTSTALQASLASVKVRVRDSVGKRRGSNGMMGKFEGEIHCWLKNCFQETSWSPPSPPPILLQKLFYGLTRQKAKTVKTSSLQQHLGKWTLSLQWWWSGAALLLQDLGDFCRWGQTQILFIFSRIFWRGTSGHLLMASSWRAPGLRCRTMTWNAPAGPPY